MENAELTGSVVREIQQAAREAVVAVSRVAVVEGDGVKVPVAFLLGSDGEVTTEPLTGALQAAHAWAESRRLEKADGPDRRNGVANLQALRSFVDHVNRFKAENSAVWADAASRKLVSVLDYHPAGATSPARWGRHRGHYACPLSEAWLAWGGGKTLELDQDDFAALLDSRDRELAAGKLPSGREAPAPAFLVSLASNLEIYSNATARRERDPNTGRLKISYSEEKGVSGDVLPPPSFLVCVPIFQDADPQLIEIRLRVTVNEGVAKFAVNIHAAGDVLREAFARLCARVEVETSLPVFIGTPE